MSWGEPRIPLHHRYRDVEQLDMQLNDPRLPSRPSTQTVQGMVTEFHTKFDGTVSSVPTVPSWNERNHRYSLIAEEWRELSDELLRTRPSIEHVAHEAADLIYSVYGLAVEFGFDLDSVIREVHVANMTKTPEGVGVKPSKGRGFKAADITLASMEL